MLTRFKARARGGITPIEVDRRLDAVRAAAEGRAPARELPPSLIAEPIEPPELRVVEAEPDPEPEIEGVLIPSDPGLAQAHRLVPDQLARPSNLVTITIAGEDGTSTLCHLIRDALANWGFSFDGPPDLKSLRWRHAVDRHLARDLRVVIKREFTNPEDGDG